jgi:hypothetical protein
MIMEQKCANCGNGKWRDGVTPITETCTKCHYVDKGALVPQPSNWKQKEQTNADRIRAMSDEELGIFLAEWAEKPWTWKKDGEGECLAWLKQPAEVPR